MKRVYGLDILRAVAILLVVYGHSMIYFGYNSYNVPYLGDGVTLFFVLSGFLIGKIYFKTVQKDAASLVTFWTRRWLRTLPAYFFVLVIMMILTRHNLLSYFTFTQTLFNGNADTYSESWSLCVEEWFYLIVPLVLYILYRVTKNKKDSIYAIVFFIILISIVRVLRTSSSMPVWDWDNFIKRTVVTRLDSIMYGVLAAYLTLYSKIKLQKLFIPGLIIWVINFSIYNIYGYTSYQIWFDIPIESIAAFVMLPYLASVKTGKGVLFRSLTFISKISYSIYLLNLSPVKAILNNDHIQPIIKLVPPVLVFFIVSFGGAYLLYRFVEKPFMKLRDKKDSKKDSKLLSKVGKVENSVI
jgi:peptidoglycan/LPS O-acetylase OafA/YrhL